ncbi:hypothetical protein [Methanocella conradii]|uniref:hypothetical protein n=1 Tax=Methanocella conradii TaxID=1175444 RepID=UPI0024B37507|nr:hypothetical protein [Methanocella conradii]MDI6896830.1 hypothetical protein [Methanocella conradii]
MDMIDPSIPILSDNEQIRAGKVEIPRILADVSKLKRLGWSPKIGLEEGLERTISKERYR